MDDTTVNLVENNKEIDFVKLMILYFWKWLYISNKDEQGCSMPEQLNGKAIVNGING